jgi:hypothetical protein
MISSQIELSSRCLFDVYIYLTLFRFLGVEKLRSKSHQIDDYYIYLKSFVWSGCKTQKGWEPLVWSLSLQCDIKLSITGQLKMSFKFGLTLLDIFCHLNWA